MGPKYCQRIRTTNDVNGNPRRLWIGYDDEGRVIAAADEGYSGRPWYDAIDLLDVNVTPAEYRRLSKLYEAILEEH